MKSQNLGNLIFHQFYISGLIILFFVVVIVLNSRLQNITILYRRSLLKWKLQQCATQKYTKKAVATCKNLVYLPENDLTANCFSVIWLIG